MIYRKSRIQIECTNKMKKKGVIEVQFNWIFVLIVGALILALFTSVVYKIKYYSEMQSVATVLSNLETLLVGAKVSTGTINLIDIPKTDIEFNCDQYFSGKIPPKQIKDKVIFSPSIIKGEKFIAWALGWEVPFKITNFLYLTSPLVRYILIGDDPTFKIINSTIPDEINKEYYPSYNPSTIQNLNNYKVRIVFFNKNVGSVPSSLVKMGSDLSAIKIEGDEEVGNISFYVNEGGTFVSKGGHAYLKKESLIGAIFIEDYANYVCTMKKALNNLNIISNIYLERSSTIKNSFENTDSCFIYHDNSNIDGIFSHVENFNLNEAQKIDIASHLVEQQNKRLQLSSCPLIY